MSGGFCPVTKVVNMHSVIRASVCYVKSHILTPEDQQEVRSLRWSRDYSPGSAGTNMGSCIVKYM